MMNEDNCWYSEDMVILSRQSKMNKGDSSEYLKPTGAGHRVNDFNDEEMGRSAERLFDFGERRRSGRVCGISYSILPSLLLFTVPTALAAGSSVVSETVNRCPAYRGYGKTKPSSLWPEAGAYHVFD